MELSKKQLKHLATIGAYIPDRCDYKAFADLDGTEARKYLESKGFVVVENRDTGTHGLAITSCGIHLSTNGYIRRKSKEDQIYATIRNALREKIKRIHEANRYYRDNPDEAAFDMNVDYRKNELEAAIEALEYIKSRHSVERRLADMLVETFKDWIDTPSEELLSDGGLVIDHLVENWPYLRETFEIIPDKCWEAAWCYFDIMVGRKKAE